MLKYIWPLLLVCFSTPAEEGVFKFFYKRDRIQTIIEHGKEKTNVIKVTGHGTAFHVDFSKQFPAQKNLLLTAGHNILDEETGKVLKDIFIRVVTEDATTEVRVNVFFYDAKFDLAIVQPKTDVNLGKKFIMSEDLPLPNETIFVSGCPKGDGPFTYKGKFLDYFYNDNPRDLSHDGLSKAKVEFFEQGISGGPVLSEDKTKFYGVVLAGISSNVDPNSKVDHEHALFVLNPIIGIFLFEAKLSQK